MIQPRRAVFLDKDGTLVEDVPYNVDPALLRFTPNAIEALQLLSSHGYALVVASNQSGLARGLFDRAALARLQAALEAMLARENIRLDGFYVCPHAPPANARRPGCLCRKPAPGLLRQAARALHIDLARSWMVGDILNDVEAGRRAGCRTVLLDVGHETEWLRTPLRTPHHTARDLLEAARTIVAEGEPVAAAPAPRRLDPTTLPDAGLPRIGALPAALHPALKRPQAA
jgi:D-glycero-D-manno-heptose 1,7-bisphosphate phosphatase